MVAEDDGGKTLTASFQADVILHMRRESYVVFNIGQ